VAGLEVAPSTGTPHYQAYLETHSKKSVGPLAKELEVLWGSYPKLLSSKGSQEENRAYCLKEATVTIEKGTPMKQGARTDLAAVSADIASGLTLGELWKKHPEQMIKYSTGIRLCYQMNSPNMTQMAGKSYSLSDFPLSMPTSQILLALTDSSVILWGESGTGKTCYARALLPNALFVSHMDDLARFDQGEHDGIIFDDISLTHLHREAQIQILDFEQPRSIHIRYTTAMIPAKTKKIFTTNNHEGFIYLAGDKALERRVKKFEIKTWDKNLLSLPPLGLGVW